MPEPISRVAVLTPDPGDHTYAGAWPRVLDRLATALAAAGVTATPTPWTAHVEDAAALREHALVLPLLTWGYHLDHARWLQACRTWQDASVPMANPASVLAWNSDKRYLDRLAGCGVAIPATTWTDRITREQVDAMFEETGTDQLIVKPVVSGGAWKTKRLKRGDELDGTPDGAAMIQPYLPTIESAGETSLLFFGGRFSHAVNKRPATGEFRIQVEFGGLYSAVDPPDQAMALAEKTLGAIDEPLLYARIDMVPDSDGRWLLMEAELIEPDFYLGQDPNGGAGFAQAVRERLA